MNKVLFCPKCKKEVSEKEAFSPSKNMLSKFRNELKAERERRRLTPLGEARLATADKLFVYLNSSGPLTFHRFCLEELLKKSLGFTEVNFEWFWEYPRAVKDFEEARKRKVEKEIPPEIAENIAFLEGIAAEQEAEAKLGLEELNEILEGVTLNKKEVAMRKLEPLFKGEIGIHEIPYFDAERIGVHTTVSCWVCQKEGTVRDVVPRKGKKPGPLFYIVKLKLPVMDKESQIKRDEEDRKIWKTRTVILCNHDFALASQLAEAYKMKPYSSSLLRYIIETLKKEPDNPVLKRETSQKDQDEYVAAGGAEPPPNEEKLKRQKKIAAKRKRQEEDFED